MGTHPRLRKAAKWGGLGLAGVCVALWAVSWWWQGSIYPRTRTSVSLCVGGVMLFWLDVGTKERHERRTVTFREGRARPLSPHWRVDALSGLVILPLWAPAALGLLVGVPAWMLDRRARRRVLAGHCATCDYDRSTLPPTAPCPECGSPPPPPLPAPPSPLPPTPPPPL